MKLPFNKESMRTSREGLLLELAEEFWDLLFIIRPTTITSDYDFTEDNIYNNN